MDYYYGLYEVDKDQLKSTIAKTVDNKVIVINHKKTPNRKSETTTIKEVISTVPKIVFLSALLVAFVFSALFPALHFSGINIIKTYVITLGVVSLLIIIGFYLSIKKSPKSEEYYKIGSRSEKYFVYGNELFDVDYDTACKVTTKLPYQYYNNYQYIIEKNGGFTEKEHKELRKYIKIANAMA